jgi:hypothetical protein
MIRDEDKQEQQEVIRRCLAGERGVVMLQVQLHLARVDRECAKLRDAPSPETLVERIEYLKNEYPNTSVLAPQIHKRLLDIVRDSMVVIERLEAKITRLEKRIAVLEGDGE